MYDIELIEPVYKRYPLKLAEIKKKFKQPLTLTEKILLTHCPEKLKKLPERGKDYCRFQPDRVAMQDATAQMALLQFLNSGSIATAVPTSVHCDHLIVAESGAVRDLATALYENREVYHFLESASQKFGIDFWPPGSGIIHQILLENYIFPGGMIIGTDSHTVNGGGLGMIAIGVGGADAVDVMIGESWELKMPKIIGVELTGCLSGWASAKDVILKLAGILTAKGGTNAIIEYFGEGASSLSCTGKATICNMGAEVGATTSIFPFDPKMLNYLKITNRDQVAEKANKIADSLQADNEVLQNPENYYDQVIRINLSELRPHINGPFTPDDAHTVGNFKSIITEKNYPEKASAVLVGSCTNSSYEDLSAVADILKQASEKKFQTEFIVTPGSESIKKLCENAGILKIIKDAGGKIMANACGPCIGQWKRKDNHGKNAIVTTFNRNFSRRNDGNPQTYAFVTSPELATAIAISGNIGFNPEKDTLTDDQGKPFKLVAPKKSELPPVNFPDAIIEKQHNSATQILVKKNSDRIQLLVPFSPFDPKDFQKMKLLIKIKDKCTTDHISMAGSWLKYRGHLENISNNLLLGAENAFSPKKGKAKNPFSCDYETIAELAKEYKKRGISSVIIAEENYGEGSSREHAAMEPRFLNVKMIIAKSFARIHETNLKKQGLLATTFSKKEDYQLIKEDDYFAIPDVDSIKPDEPLAVNIFHKNGEKESILVNHSYNHEQILWLKAGSALNALRNKKELK